MKKNIVCLKIVCALVVLISFSSCGTGKNQNQPPQISQPATSEAKPPLNSQLSTTSLLPPQSGSKEETQKFENITSESSIKEELLRAAENYKYQLPEEAKNITWEYADALCNVIFEEVNANFAESVGMDKYKIHRYDISDIIPESIYQALEKRLIEDVDVYTYNGKFSSGAYLARIAYFKFDLNDDGLDDFLTRAYVRNEMGGDRGQYASDIFITQKDGTYKEIACGLDYNVSILKSKTNGMYDILTGYYGNDICRFNGEDSYEIPFKSPYRLYLKTVFPNNLINLHCAFGNGFPIDYQQFYAVAYVDDERVKEHILYACKPDGTPRIYTELGGYADGGGLDFYAELSEGTEVGRYDYIDVNQIKFINAEQVDNS